MANERVSISTGGASRATVSVGGAPIVSSVSSASKIKIGKLEDNIGNLDKGEDGVIATGETLVYNAESGKWESVSLQEKVNAAVESSEALALAVAGQLQAGTVLDGGTF